MVSTGASKKHPSYYAYRKGHTSALHRQPIVRFWDLTAQRGWAPLVLDHLSALVYGSAASARENSAGHVDDAAEHYNSPYPDHRTGATNSADFELELELIQTQIAQKPMLRAEVYARALHASHNARESGGIGGRAMHLMSGRGVGECGSGRPSYGSGVISEVGWLSSTGAATVHEFPGRMFSCLSCFKLSLNHRPFERGMEISKAYGRWK